MGLAQAVVLADVVAQIERSERFASQEELRIALSERFGRIGNSTLSEWFGELDHSIARRAADHQKAIG